MALEPGGPIGAKMVDLWYGFASKLDCGGPCETLSAEMQRSRSREWKCNACDGGRFRRVRRFEAYFQLRRIEMSGDWIG